MALHTKSKAGSSMRWLRKFISSVGSFFRWLFNLPDKGVKTTSTLTASKIMPKNIWLDDADGEFDEIPFGTVVQWSPALRRACAARPRVPINWPTKAKQNAQKFESRITSSEIQVLAKPKLFIGKLIKHYWTKCQSIVHDTTYYFTRWAFKRAKDKKPPRTLKTSRVPTVVDIVDEINNEVVVNPISSNSNLKDFDIDSMRNMVGDLTCGFNEGQPLLNVCRALEDCDRWLVINSKGFPQFLSTILYLRLLSIVTINWAFPEEKTHLNCLEYRCNNPIKLTSFFKSKRSIQKKLENININLFYNDFLFFKETRDGSRNRFKVMKLKQDAMSYFIDNDSILTHEFVCKLNTYEVPYQHLLGGWSLVA